MHTARKKFQAKVVEGAGKPAEEVDALMSLLDLENHVWEMQEMLLQMADEVENKEPLQAKQSYENLMVRLTAIGEFVNGA